MVSLLLCKLVNFIGLNTVCLGGPVSHYSRVIQVKEYIRWLQSLTVRLLFRISLQVSVAHLGGWEGQKVGALWVQIIGLLNCIYKEAWDNSFSWGIYDLVREIMKSSAIYQFNHSVNSQCFSSIRNCAQCYGEYPW